MISESGARVLAGAAMLLGAGLAASAVVEAPSEALPPDGVARVDGHIISRAEYQRALDGLAKTRRAPLDAALRARVLERLIDETLLVQRGLELGLAHSDARVRAELSTAMIDWVTARGEIPEAPEDDVLRAYFESHRAAFTGAPQVTATVLYFEGPEAPARAREARARLRAGHRPTRADALPGVPPGATDVRGPLSRLRGRLGATLAEALGTQPIGAVTVLERPGGLVLLRVDAREAAETGYEAVRPAVLARWRAEAGDRALQDFLQQARSGAQILRGETTP